MSAPRWEIGLEVTVAPRTWPGINKSGGHGKIVKIHYTSQGIVDTLDVQYTLGKRIDSNLDTSLVKPHIELDRGRRSRRGRDFFATAYQTEENAKKAQAQGNPEKEEKENDDPGKATEVKNEKKTKKIAAKNERKPPKKKNNNITKTATASRPREKTLPDNFPKKKRSKANGNPASAPQSNKKTSTTNTAEAIIPTRPTADSDKERDGVPKFVVTNPSSSLDVFSPLAVGRAGNVESPMRFPSISEEQTDNMNQATEAAEKPGIGVNFGRKTLKNVFNHQMQDATKYIDSLVGGTNTKNAPVNAKDDKPSKLPPNEEPISYEESRRINDLKTRLWKEMSEKDGELPMDKIEDFGHREEIAAAIRDLTLEGRLMESEGVLYQTE